MGKASHAQSTQNNKFAKSLQYFKKKMKDEVDFLEQINVKVFHRLMQSYLIGMIRGIPKIFKITMQYLRKEMSDEVDFLHADKHSFPQVNTIFLVGLARHAQSTQT